jgi:transcriptional regulator with XRE-family HTH domain
MPTLRDALKADLKALGITQKEFVTRLPVSQQAINQWFLKNTVPEGRQNDIIAVLGPESLTAQGIAHGFALVEPGHAEPPRAHYEAQRPASSRPFRNQVEDRQRSYEDLLAVLLADLPGTQLHQILQVGPYRRRFDYVSSTLVADVVAPSTMTSPGGRVHINVHRFARNLIDLAVARKNDRTARNYLLIVVLSEAGNDPSTGPAIQQLVWDAGHFDVSVFPVRSFAEAGRVIVETELQDLADDDFAPPPRLMGMPDHKPT